MVVKKIKFWARIVQIMYFVLPMVWIEFEKTQPQIEKIKYNITLYSAKLVIIEFLGIVLLSEAIVRLVGYFAELIAEKNNDNECSF